MNGIKNFMCVLFEKQLYIFIFGIIILFILSSILFLMISGKLLSINKIIFSEEFDLMKFFKEFFIVSLKN